LVALAVLGIPTDDSDHNEPAELLWPFILGAALCRLLGFHIPGIDIT
jgi:hypothetical protein